MRKPDKSGGKDKGGGKRSQRGVEIDVPDVRPTVNGILTADWHFSITPPIARCKEEDWLKTQSRYLHELRRLQFKLEGRSNNIWASGDAKREVPIIVAGDIFHRWNSPAELINMMLSSMPDKVYAIPGNHDLENHSLETIRRTAYWTLVEAGKIVPIDGMGSGNPMIIADKILAFPFPYGEEVRPLDGRGHDLYQVIAVVHKYVWTDKTRHPGANVNDRLDSFRKQCQGYDVVVVGDNHVPFIATKKKPVVVNTGSLMRTTIDQVDYEPRVWILYSDNTVEPYYLDVSKDVMYDARDLSRVKVGNERLVDFLSTMRDLKASAIDFEEAVRRVLQKNKVNKEVQKMVAAALEMCK